MPPPHGRDRLRILDLLVQRLRDERAALRIMRKLLRKQGFAPRLIVTGKLRSSLPPYTIST